MRADEIFEEEQQIADEQAAVLGSAILTEPIGALKHPEAVTVGKDVLVTAAVRRMVDHRVGCVIVEEAGRLVGIFTERDLLIKVVGHLDPAVTPVEAVMTPKPETLSPDTKIAYALNKMSNGGFRHIPVVDENGRATGVVSMRDIVNYIAELFRHEVLNLPPEPDLAISRTREGA